MTTTNATFPPGSSKVSPPSATPVEAPVKTEEISPRVESEKQSICSRYSAWRKSFGLPNPGGFDQLHREVRGVLTNNLIFDGAKLDMSKGLSPNFQVTHSFALGSQVSPSTYNFGAFVGGDKKGFMHGTIDSEGSLQARGTFPITKRLSTKFQSQLGNMPGQAMVQIEADYSGIDYSLNVKAVNPSPVDLTGIYVGSYLQSITKNIAIGTEVALQHPQMDVFDPQVSAVGKVTIGQQGTLTANYSMIGVVQASYHHKVSEQIELGADFQFVAAQNRREAVCTIGGKWEFRTSTFRGQVDTNGRVSSVLEEKIAPGFSVFFCGDLDHVKNSSKFGFGLQLEN